MNRAVRTEQNKVRTVDGILFFSNSFSRTFTFFLLLTVFSYTFFFKGFEDCIVFDELLDQYNCDFSEYIIIHV